MTMFRIKFSTWQQTPYFLIMVLQNSIEGLIVMTALFAGLIFVIKWQWLPGSLARWISWRQMALATRSLWCRNEWMRWAAFGLARLSNLTAMAACWAPLQLSNQCSSGSNSSTVNSRGGGGAITTAPTPPTTLMMTLQINNQQKQQNYLMKIPRHIFRDVCMPLCVCMWYCLDFIFFGFVSTLCVCHLA